MNKAHLLILIFLLVITACSGLPAAQETAESVTATPTLTDPQVNVTPAPDVDEAIARFMTAWQAEDYPTMYSLLAAEVRNSLTEEDFTARYRDAAVALTLQFDSGIEYDIQTTMTNPNDALATVSVNFNTYLFETINRPIEFTLTRENGAWFVVWHEGMILPELAGGNQLEIVRQPTPRGNIYANDGTPIVANEDVVAIGFTPGGLNQDLLGLFYTTMARMTIFQAAEIAEMVDTSLPGDYISLGEVPESEVDRNMSALSSLSGVFLNYYSSRFYYDSGIAPQAIGHLTYISEEAQYEYLRRGYSISERFGSTGLENSFEDTLSGERGATLYLKDANGAILSKIAERQASPGQSITTTIDYGLQYRLQQSLGNYRGAIVVMEVDTGRVLAMVSNPPFDPNLFDINNTNFVYVNNPYIQPDDPVFNRATSGQYPLGSVFKIITMAAGLESGVFTPESEIYCGHSITVCGGSELFDWTLEKERPPSGDLTLPEGLMRSCNPWFYYIGEQLFLQGYPNLIADMSRDFGLGALTGIEISEQPGNIPQQVNTCDANAQLSIGQGEMTVTPLQVARFVAAVANGGTLFRPALIEQIGPENGNPSYTFAPEEVGTLPVSEGNLKIIQDAMLEVIKNARGTAQLQLGSMSYRSYGKTGTAQNPFGESHAWFAGYTDVGSEIIPDIAVAVILENAGEGSEMAAPVFRRAVSLYFSDYANTGINLPWEAFPYVVASPTPIPSNTPIPTNTPIATETPMEGEAGADDTP